MATADGEVHAFLMNDAGTGVFARPGRPRRPLPLLERRLDVWHARPDGGGCPWRAPVKIWEGTSVPFDPEDAEASLLALRLVPAAATPSDAGVAPCWRARSAWAPRRGRGNASRCAGTARPGRARSASPPARRRPCRCVAWGTASATCA